MKQKLIWIAIVWLLFGTPIFAQQAGFYLQAAYSKPFCKNVYISPKGESGVALGIGLFNQVNDNWEISALIGMTTVDFNDVEYLYYDDKGGPPSKPVANFYKGKISLLASSLEFQTRYFVLDHKLGVGLGLFGGWYSDGSGVNNQGTEAMVTNGTIDAGGSLNSGAEIQKVFFTDRGIAGAILALYYQPMNRMQLFLRYDLNTIDIWYEAREVIGRTNYNMLKAGCEIRLIKNYTKRRY
jgi:hypothetical protein